MNAKSKILISKPDLLEICDKSTTEQIVAAEKHLAEVEGDSDFDEDLAAVTGKELKDKKKKDGKSNGQKAENNSDIENECDEDLGSDIDDEMGSEEELDEDISEDDGDMSKQDEDMEGEDSNISEEDEDDFSDDAPEGMP